MPDVHAPLSPAMAPFEATVILPAHTPALFRAAVSQAAAALRNRQAVALPTETVYGLAVNALDPAAVTRLFQIKGRPSHNPVIVHVTNPAMARRCTRDWPDAAEALARAFWPGPLTLVLPKAPEIPDEVTAGQPTVAVRCPSHALFQAVLEACGFPLAAPSANLSGSTSPTRARHVLRSLAGRIPLIVNGGPCRVGIESTVVDLTSTEPRILRPGILDETVLSQVIGPVHAPGGVPAGGPPLSPGLLDRHYAPQTPLRVLSWTDDRDLHRQLTAVLSCASDGAGVGPARTADPWPVCLLVHTRIPTQFRARILRVLPRDPKAFARLLYAELHRCDRAGTRVIIVEAVPDSGPWRAIHDRLRRAAT